MEYKLSIVIPTKNRYETLFPCLDVLKSKTYDELEVIVHDNSNNNEEAIKYFAKNKRNNIRYYYKASSISVAENMDKAIEKSSGKYVCAIGDDDAVIPRIIEVVELMDKNGIDSCSYIYAKYYWQNMKNVVNEYVPLILYKGMDGGWSYKDPKEELIKIMNTIEFSMNRLAIVYHGIVSREILNEINLKTGTYCPGPSPDLANATAATLITKRHVHIDMPLSIAGHSYNSAGGMGTRKKHVKELSEATWIAKEDKENWEKKIPFVWTAETVWAESLIKSLKKMGRIDVLSDFNYLRFYANFILHHPRYTFRAIKASPSSLGGLVVYGPYYAFKKVRRIFALRIDKERCTNWITLGKEVKSLHDAVVEVETYAKALTIHARALEI